MSAPNRDALLAEQYNTPCEYCKELDEEGFECPDEPHHGSVYYCDECEAEFYKEWGTETILAGNEKATINHPNLPKLWKK